MAYAPLPVAAGKRVGGRSASEWAWMENQAQQQALQNQGNQMPAQQDQMFNAMRQLIANQQQQGMRQEQPYQQPYQPPSVGDIYGQGMTNAMGAMGAAQQANASRVSQNNAQQSMLNNQLALTNMQEQGLNARMDSQHPFELEKLKQQQLGQSNILGQLLGSSAFSNIGGQSGGGAGQFKGVTTNCGAGVSPYASNPAYQQPSTPFTGGGSSGGISSPGMMAGSPSSTPQGAGSLAGQSASGATGWASLPGYANNSFSGGTAQQVRTAAAGEYGQPESGVAPYKNPNGNFQGKPPSNIDKGYARRMAMMKQSPGYGPTTARYAATSKLT